MRSPREGGLEVGAKTQAARRGGAEDEGTSRFPAGGVGSKSAPTRRLPGDFEADGEGTSRFPGGGVGSKSARRRRLRGEAGADDEGISQSRRPPLQRVRRRNLLKWGCWRFRFPASGRHSGLEVGAKPQAARRPGGGGGWNFPASADGSERSPNLGLPVRSALRCPGAARDGRLAVPSPKGFRRTADREANLTQSAGVAFAFPRHFRAISPQSRYTIVTRKALHRRKWTHDQPS